MLLFCFWRESNEKSYQLLRDTLDLFLTINPDNVPYLLLQARLYFHLGIWPEKVLPPPLSYVIAARTLESHSVALTFPRLTLRLTRSPTNTFSHSDTLAPSPRFSES